MDGLQFEILRRGVAAIDACFHQSLEDLVSDNVVYGVLKISSIFAREHDGGEDLFNHALRNYPMDIEAASIKLHGRLRGWKDTTVELRRDDKSLKWPVDLWSKVLRSMQSKRDFPISRTVCRALMPDYIIKGRQNTCVCQALS